MDLDDSQLHFSSGKKKRENFCLDESMISRLFIGKRTEIVGYIDQDG